MVVECALAHGHALQNVMDYGDALKPLPILNSNLGYQSFQFFVGLLVIAFPQPVKGYLAISLEPLFRKLLLEPMHKQGLEQEGDYF